MQISHKTLRMCGKVSLGVLTLWTLSTANGGATNHTLTSSAGNASGITPVAKTQAGPAIERFEQPPVGQTWSGTPGKPPTFTLTYSFVPDGTSIPDLTACDIPGAAGASDLYATLNAIFPDGPGEDPENPGRPLDANGVWAILFDRALNSERPEIIGEPAHYPAINGWNAMSAAQVVLLSDPSPPNDDPSVLSEQNVPLVAIGNAGAGDQNDLAGRGHFRISARAVPSQINILAWAVPPGTTCLGGGNTAIWGDIILNSAAVQANPSPNTIRRIAAFVMGRALGLQETCVTCEDGSDVGSAMEPCKTPIIPEQLLPQLDDRLALQRLYGDFSEGSVGPFNITDILNSVPLSPTGQSIVRLSYLSIDNATDEDVFLVQIPIGDIPQEIILNMLQEVGSDQSYITCPGVGLGGGRYSYAAPVAGVCPVSGTIQDTGIVQDLKIWVTDEAGTILPVRALCTTIPGTPEAIIVNCGQPSRDPLGGFQESLSCVLPDTGANYLIHVSGDGVTDAIQPYYLDVQVGPSAAAGAEPVRPILVNLNIDQFWMRDIRGQGMEFYNLEGGWPRPDHVVFEQGVRPDFAFFQWDGVNPNVRRDSAEAIAQQAHPTGVTAMAAGSDFGQFRGVADRARIAAGSVATRFGAGGGFLTALEPIYYNLWGSVDPTIYGPAGMISRARVMNLSWGSLSDAIGESSRAHALDAAAIQNDILFVVSAGNSGRIDNTATCEGTGGNTPGGLFIGSRTVGSPASGWNSISIGASASSTVGDPDETTPPAPGTFRNPKNIIAPFSSRGPLDAFDWEAETVVNNVRTGVSMCAPGTGIIRFPQSQLPGGQPQCPFNGFTNVSFLNLPWQDDEDPASNDEFLPVQGTSFSAPMIAGVALLGVQSAIQQQLSVDPLVLKACLMNSAVHQTGWSNTGNPGKPQDLRDGRTDDLTTEISAQPLDVAQGSGILDIGRFYLQYLHVQGEVDPTTGLAYPEPHLSNGATRDVAATNPASPTVRFIPTPPIIIGGAVDGSLPADGSQQPELAGGGESGPAMRSLDQLPLSAIEVAERVQKARRLSNETDLAYVNRPDTLDPNPRRGDNPLPTPDAPTTGSPQLPTDTQIPDINTPPGPQLRFVPGALVVNDIGWDHAMLGVRTVTNPPPGMDAGNVGYIDYVVGPAFCGDVITATLVWNRTVRITTPALRNLANPGVDRLTALEFEDIDLEIYQSDQSGEFPFDTDPIFASRSRWNNVEHVWHDFNASDCPNEGFGTFLTIRVKWDSRAYDTFRNQRNGDIEYAIAWRLERNPNRAGACTACQCPVYCDTSLTTLGGVIQRYNTHAGQPAYSFDYDMTRDGRINLSDIGWLIQHWND